MTRQSLRDRIVANVRKINAQVKTPQADTKVSAPRIFALLGP